MKTIQISDDVYEHLLKNVSSIGEDASSILRRLLKIRPTHDVRSATDLQDSHGDIQVDADGASSNAKVNELLNDPFLHLERDAVRRFLYILGWLARTHGADFAAVTEISGRKRLYFSKTSETLEQSGVNVHPQQIPDTEYWVVTNNDTPKKKRMLEDVLTVLHYGAADRNTIIRMLA